MRAITAAGSTMTSLALRWSANLRRVFPQHPFAIKTTLRNCFLVNFSMPPHVLARALPRGLVPDVCDANGRAYVSVVIAHEEAMRPAGVPRALGFDFTHVVYRAIVKSPTGERGVYVLRSDADSVLMSVAGNVFSNFYFHIADVCWGGKHRLPSLVAQNKPLSPSPSPSTSKSTSTSTSPSPSTPTSTSPSPSTPTSTSTSTPALSSSPPHPHHTPERYVHFALEPIRDSRANNNNASNNNTTHTNTNTNNNTNTNTNTNNKNNTNNTNTNTNPTNTNTNTNTTTNTNTNVSINACTNANGNQMTTTNTNTNTNTNNNNNNNNTHAGIRASFDLHTTSSVMHATSVYAGQHVQENAQKYFVELYVVFNAWPKRDYWSAVRLDRTMWNVVALETTPTTEFDYLQSSDLFRGDDDDIRLDSTLYVHENDYHWHTLEKDEYRLPDHMTEVDRNTVIMYHDGLCPLCSREVAHYRRLADSDPTCKVRFEDVSDTQQHEESALMKYFGVSQAEALARIQVLDHGVLRSGIAGFVAVWENMPYWRYLAKLFKIPFSIEIAELAYSLWLRVKTPLGNKIDIGASCRVRTTTTTTTQTTPKNMQRLETLLITDPGPSIKSTRTKNESNCKLPQ